MTKIISSAEMPDKGYCDQCDEPKILILLTIKGWPYKIKVCKDCMNTLGQVLVETSKL